MPWKDKFIAIILHYSHLHLVTTPLSSLSLSPSVFSLITNIITSDKLRNVQGTWKEIVRESKLWNAIFRWNLLLIIWVITSFS